MAEAGTTENEGTGDITIGTPEDKTLQGRKSHGTKYLNKFYVNRILGTYGPPEILAPAGGFLRHSNCCSLRSHACFQKSVTHPLTD